jgi:hypothetical protein
MLLFDVPGYGRIVSSATPDAENSSDVRRTGLEVTE